MKDNQHMNKNEQSKWQTHDKQWPNRFFGVAQCQAPHTSHKFIQFPDISWEQHRNIMKHRPKKALAHPFSPSLSQAGTARLGRAVTKAWRRSARVLQEWAFVMWPVVTCCDVLWCVVTWRVFNIFSTFFQHLNLKSHYISPPTDVGGDEESPNKSRQVLEFRTRTGLGDLL